MPDAPQRSTPSPGGPRLPRESEATVIVITGASSGIGRCTAGLFASRGWKVGLIARGGAGLRAARDDVERTAPWSRRHRST